MLREMSENVHFPSSVSGGRAAVSNSGHEHWSDNAGKLALSALLIISLSACRISIEVPEGRQWVAYTLGHPGGSTLFVVPTSGTTSALRLTSDDGGVEIRDFRWSPDSHRIVISGTLSHFIDVFERASEVFLVDRDGGTPTKINGSIGDPVKVEVGNPQWSPDGRYIAQEVFNRAARSGLRLGAGWTLAGIYR